MPLPVHTQVHMAGGPQTVSTQRHSPHIDMSGVGSRLAPHAVQFLMDVLPSSDTGALSGHSEHDAWPVADVLPYAPEMHTAVVEGWGRGRA